MGWEELDTQFNPEIIEIAAVTGFSGPNSSSLPGDDRRYASIRLIAWQDLASGEVHEERAVLCATVRKPSDFTRHFKKESIVKLKVQADKDPQLRRFRLVEKTGGLFARFPELKEILARQQQPFYFDDEVLGRLKLNRSFDQLEGSIQWCGDAIRLALAYDEASEAQPSVALARDFFEHQADWDGRVREYAASDFTEVANDSWLDEDHQIDEEEFARRVSVTDINVEGDGGFTFWCDDDEIFRGHAILVSGNTEDGLDCTEMYG